jgi:carbon-monoxide dehydrogenase medium subunit
MSVPAAFDYHPVQTVDEAIALLQQYGDEAKILAGGHSLLPAMKLRLSQPEHLIDIGKVDGLSYIRQEHDAIAVGALTTYVTLLHSDLLRQNFPILIEGTELIGDQQVRNRGTIGGSIAHSDPAADMPGIVLALKAHTTIQGPAGKRTILADDFFIDTFTTALEAEELVTEIRFPLLPAHSGSAYEKLENKASHYAVAGCAAIVTLDANGTCQAASIAITGAATTTARAKATEAALVGKKLTGSVIEEAASHAADGLTMIADLHGSEEYRRQMATVITRRAITRALSRASK